jgi:hypothetical protein
LGGEKEKDRATALVNVTDFQCSHATICFISTLSSIDWKEKTLTTTKVTLVFQEVTPQGRSAAATGLPSSFRMLYVEAAFLESTASSFIPVDRMNLRSSGLIGWMCLPQPRIRISGIGCTTLKIDKLSAVISANDLGAHVIILFSTINKLPSYFTLLILNPVSSYDWNRSWSSGTLSMRLI